MSCTKFHSVWKQLPEQNIKDIMNFTRKCSFCNTIGHDVVHYDFHSFPNNYTGNICTSCSTMSSRYLTSANSYLELIGADVDKISKHDDNLCGFSMDKEKINCARRGMSFQFEYVPCGDNKIYDVESIYVYSFIMAHTWFKKYKDNIYNLHEIINVNESRRIIDINFIMFNKF